MRWRKLRTQWNTIFRLWSLNGRKATSNGLWWEWETKGLRRERHYRPLHQLKLALLMRQEETYVWACQQWAAVEGALTCVSQRGTGERDGIRVICVFLAVHCLKRGSGRAKWPAFNLKVLTGQGLHWAPPCVWPDSTGQMVSWSMQQWPAHPPSWHQPWHLSAGNPAKSWFSQNGVISVAGFLDFSPRHSRFLCHDPVASSWTEHLISLVHSLSRVQLFATPWTAAH